jgi:hypothetical protein
MYYPIAENTLLRHLAEDRDRMLTQHARRDRARTRLATRRARTAA